MNTVESKQLATARRMCTALERIADALEGQGEPVLAVLEDVQGISWKDAALMLSETCKGAKKCTEGVCPMYEWCHTSLLSGLAPAYWGTVEG